jgi:hypothetical protein
MSSRHRAWKQQGRNRLGFHHPGEQVGGEAVKAKEYLKQVELLDVKIRQKKIELAGLKEDATCTGAFDYSAEKVQTSAKADSMSNKVAKYVDLEKEIHEDIERFTELKHKVIGQIHMLDDITYMEILFKKYIEYKTLKDIAVEMKYSYGRTKHIHGFALEAFRIKVLENSAPNSTI